jgi:hypothetical protein
VLAGADKSVEDTSKKVVGTSGPNTFVIAPGETPLGKKALEKSSAILNQQGKKVAKNKISTPRIVGKKSLEKPSAISKLQEEKLAKNKSSTPPIASKQALKKPSSAISKQQEKEIAVNKTSMRPTRKRSKRNTKETPRNNPWAMDNPITNSKRAFSLMVISKRLLLLPESSTNSTCNAVSQMIILTLWSHFGPRVVHGLRDGQTDSNCYLCNSVICTISSAWMLWI